MVNFTVILIPIILTVLIFLFQLALNITTPIGLPHERHAVATKSQVLGRQRTAMLARGQTEELEEECRKMESRSAQNGVLQGARLRINDGDE